MFYGAMTLNITKLIVNDYVITSNTNYLPMSSMDSGDASITCTHCSIINISSSHTKALFHSAGSIHIVNCEMRNISTPADILFSERGDIPHDSLSRQIKLFGSQFSDIFARTILHVSPSNRDVKLLPESPSIRTLPTILLSIQSTDPPNEMIYECMFNGINATAIINDTTMVSSVDIKNTYFTVKSGMVFFALHYRLSQVNMNNVSVLSDQLMSGTDMLFQLPGNTVTKIMDFRVMIQYNTNQCNSTGRQYSFAIGAWCNVYNCPNPPRLMTCHGQV